MSPSEPLPHTGPGLTKIGLAMLRGVILALTPGIMSYFFIQYEINTTFIYFMATTLISLTLLIFIHEPQK